MWILVRVFGLFDLTCFYVVSPIAFGSNHVVLLIETDIEPNWRIEGTVLVQTKPAQVSVEVFAILRRIEVSICDAPIGNRTRHPMDQLTNRELAFLNIRRIAVKVLADDNVGGQLTPARWDLAIGLFKENFAAFILDGGASRFPLNGIKRSCYLGWAESTFDFKPTASAASFVCCA